MLNSDDPTHAAVRRQKEYKVTYVQSPTFVCLILVWRTSIQTLDSNRFSFFSSVSSRPDILLYNQSLASLTSKLVFSRFKQTLTFPLFSSFPPPNSFFFFVLQCPPPLTFRSSILVPYYTLPF